jgi:hypothetical protein
MGAGDYMQRAEQLKMQQDLSSSAADTTASLQRTRQLMAEVPPSFAMCKYFFCCIPCAKAHGRGAAQPDLLPMQSMLRRVHFSCCGTSRCLENILPSYPFHATYDFHS